MCIPFRCCQMETPSKKNVRKASLIEQAVHMDGMGPNRTRWLSLNCSARLPDMLVGRPFVAVRSHRGRRRETTLRKMAVVPSRCSKYRISGSNTKSGATTPMTPAFSKLGTSEPLDNLFCFLTKRR